MAKHGDYYTGSTANRGVEAKEIEITNTRLDGNTITSSSTSLPAEGSTLADSSGQQATHPLLDATGSYVQVVVQARRAAAARLPAASSPARPGGAGAGAGDGAPPRRSAPRPRDVADAAGDARAAAAVCLDAQPLHSQQQRTRSNQRSLNNASDKSDFSENGPERVEVYYFERCGGAYLATRAGGRATRVERGARGARRAAAAAQAEALAAAHLLLAAPVALLVALQRCMLTAARDLVAGSVQTAADYALKPALALAFNAAVAPALACAGNAAHALRDALRPLWLAAGDALDAPARALARLSLVTVRLERCHCGCRETDLA